MEENSRRDSITRTCTIRTTSVNGGICYYTKHRYGPHSSLAIFSEGKDDVLLAFDHTKIFPQESLFLKFVRDPVTLWFVI